MDTEKILQEMLDKEAIMQNQYQYAWCVDTKNWEEFANVFSDDLVVDMRYRFPDKPVAHYAPKEWAENVKKIVSGLQATQHFMSNFKIDVDGDTATCRCYVRAMHFLPNMDGDPWMQCFSLYNNKYKRTEKGWKISFLKITHWWWEGNQDLYNRAQKNIAEGIYPKPTPID